MKIKTLVQKGFASINELVATPFRKLKNRHRSDEGQTMIQDEQQQQHVEMEAITPSPDPGAIRLEEFIKQKRRSDQLSEQERVASDSEHLEQAENHDVQFPGPSAQKATSNIAAAQRGEIPMQPQKDVDVEELLFDFDIFGQQLADAEKQLDTRHGRFDEEKAERQDKLNGGFEVETESALDMQHVQETRRLTRFLIKAERQYYDAKSALIAAGVQPPGSQIESGFVDDVRDGYRVSQEREIAACADRGRIHAWLIDIPDVDGLDCDLVKEDTEPPESLDECGFREIEMWESRSMVAEGAARRSIDKWRAQAESCAPKIFCGPSEQT